MTVMFRLLYACFLLFFVIEARAVIDVNDQVPITTEEPSESRTTTASCTDQITTCQQYITDCSDPDYQPMLYKFCRFTCGLCDHCLDSDPQCPVWGANGFCTNPFYKDQWYTCSKTCNLC